MRLFSSILSLNLDKIIVRNISFRKVTNWYATLHRPSKKNPPYSHVVQIGDPILRQNAELVPVDLIKSEQIKFLINNLKLVMKNYNCVGLAAPQIGIPLQVFAIEFSPQRKKEFNPEVFKNRKMSIVPFTAFINPVMKIVNYNKIILPEACESVKGYSADVARYSEIEVTGFNENGDAIKVTADGWTARIIQHEFDHLNGKIYTDIMDRKTFNCTCWQAVNERGGKIELPFSPS